MPHATTPVTFANARFTVYAPGVIRLEYRKHGNFPERASFLTAEVLPPPLAAEVVVEGDRLVLRTDCLTLTFIDDGKEFGADNLFIAHPSGNGRELWRPGMSNEPLGTVVRSLDAVANLDRQEHETFFNRLGRFSLEDQAQVYRTADGQWVEASPYDLMGQDWWFFGYGTDYAGALQQFVRLFGRIPLVPRWVFGFWYSKWFEYTDTELLAIVAQYRERGLPMDVLVVDTAWREKDWLGYNWHPQRFPDPAGFLAKLKALGLTVPLNDHPGYSDDVNELPSGDDLIPLLQERLGDPPQRGLWECHWGSRTCVETWKALVLSKQITQGVDFWWVNGWGYHDPFRFLKSQLWINHHYSEVVGQYSGKRALILSRWGGWGSHRYPVQFSGDAQSTWEMLQYQIRFTAESGGAGACYWSHDIGGFHGKVIDDDLYIRWVQFGAFSPVFRTHSAYGIREPFAYSELALQVFRQVVRWRYAMLPYWYQLAHEAHETGLPLCRPMFLHYPEETAAYAHPQQYLLGRDMLVAPVCQAGERVRQQVWLPRGTWISATTGECLQGPCTHLQDVPLAEVPVYYRQGAIIPHLPPAECTKRQPWGDYWFDIYPTPGATTLDLYEDDGETPGHAGGEYATTHITVTDTGDSLTVHIAPTTGDFPGCKEERHYTFNLYLNERQPAQVSATANSQPLPELTWQTGHYFAAGTCESGATFLTISCGTSNAREVVEVVISFT